VSIIRNTFFVVLYNLGFGRILLNLNRSRRKIPVLVFHKILPEYDEVWPGTKPKLFEDILILLKKHYTILPLEDLLTKNEMQLKDTCFITFDDGYTDFLDYAYPILVRQETPVTLFILPNSILNNGYIWTSKIMFFVKHYSPLEIEAFFISKKVDINFIDYNNPFKLNLAITIQLCEMTHKERSLIIDELHHKFIKENRIVKQDLLSFEELRLFDKSIVSVGSHSLSHPSFKEETSVDFIENELFESKNVIEKELNTKVFSFAFPFTKLNDLAFNIAKKTYKICFTRINDFVDLKKIKEKDDYRFDLPRFNIHHNTPEEVFFLINGFHKKLRR
jgi:peptidoglycan/xylan/chitin deacetylase (PgdA/CDA1 family)